jgi:hypothetical protein
MSGGSMNYLYSKIENDANFECNTPQRAAFRKHLVLVVQALKDIEWVDSGDCASGDENEAIMKCITKTEVLASCVEEAKKTLNELKQAIKEAK